MCRLSYLKYNTKLDMKKKTFLHNVLPRYKCKLSKVSRENFKLAQCVLKVDYWPKTYRFSERPYIITPFVEKISHYQYALTLILSTWPSVKVNCKLPNYKVWPIQNLKKMILLKHYISYHWGLVHENGVRSSSKYSSQILGLTKLQTIGRTEGEKKRFFY